MTRIAALLAVPALLLSACEDPAQEPASAPADTAVTPGPAAPPATSPAPASTRVVGLDPEGLRLIDRQSGSTASLAFGQPAEQVLAMVGASRGAPAERGTNSECGAGPLDFASWDDGLTLWFQNGAFAGWATNRQGATLMTGVGVGSSRADLEGAHAVTVEETTLGTEFTFGGVSGLLENGRVSNLWAGVSCNFR